VGIVPSLREKKSISILAALQSGAKERADKRENKGPHSGPKYGVMNGGFPLIYESFMGQIRGKICDPFKKKKKRHTWNALTNTLWGFKGGALSGSPYLMGV